jgi:membrane-bound serine protease (ClpP class)
MIRSVVIFVVLAILGPCCAADTTAAARKVYVIAVSGNVDPSMASFIKRALDSVHDADPLFVLELDTFGGRVDSALQIVDTLLSVPRGKTIAFVTAKAISAGALIALSCNQLVMKPHATIGDCAPISFSGEGPKMLGEKFQSPLRAKFRMLARRNGFPVVLAEAMVSKDIAVYQVKMNAKTVFMSARQYDELSDSEKAAVVSRKTVVAKGELLTMDAAEALTLGFSKRTVADLDQLLAGMGLGQAEIVRIEETWSESFVGVITAIAPILMVIGLAGLYIEVKSPGFGLPGLIGIACLGLVFFGQYLVGLANYAELLLLVAGVLLLLVELFVLPGFGLAGVAGILCVATGMILSFQDFVIPKPAFPWQAELLTHNIVQVLGAALAAFLVSMLFLRYVFPKLGTVARGPYLATALTDAHADSAEAARVRVGDSGRTLTFLRPAGKVEIAGDRFDVVSQGEFIEKDTAVVVIAIEGNRVIVARKEVS